MSAHLVNILAAAVFACALVHTFSAQYFKTLARRFPRHASSLHLLGEVEIVFAFWALVLIGLLSLFAGSEYTLGYVKTRHFTEPLFVFVIIVVAASKPLLNLIERLMNGLAKKIPTDFLLAKIWLSLALVPLLGSLITEPAAMTIAALMLTQQVFKLNVPERLKYASLGVLFVNISIGGMLTSYAAPPVLMVANAWQWDSGFMLSTFGWRAAIAVLINATAMCYFLRNHIDTTALQNEMLTCNNIPFIISLIHMLFLAGIVMFSRQPILFTAIFLLFLAFIRTCPRHQSPLLIKQSLLVGLFLAGLIILGGMQQWWLQPVVSSLAPVQLFFGATALTAITDNAALTYLGSLMNGLSDEMKYMLMAGAVTGGGLTVIANAPNPAGATLLKQGFQDCTIRADHLLVGALAPTAVTVVMFLI